MNDSPEFNLNLQQKQAVKYNQGPLLIIAGAGTGKTGVVVEKIKHLIKAKLTKPEQILALTFTEKAAFEMEERVDKALPYGYFQMYIATFHAFADQVLKEEISQIGLSPGYRLMTEAETIIFLRKNLFLFDLHYFRPLGNPNKFLEGLLQHFSRLKDEDISPDQYLLWAKSLANKKPYSLEDKKKYVELGYAYKKYQLLKVRESLMDFSDLVYYLIELFRKRKSILHKYQNKFKYVFVDEFQDTNIAQYQLIKLLCPAKNKPRLTVVGDDSQAIYKFRGASVSNILNFMKDYPHAKKITLKQNYRSNQIILDAAYQLIKNNDPDTLEYQLGISKKLVAQKKDIQNSLGFFLGEKVESEADFVTKKILSLKKKYRYSDFAILVRANNHAEPFIRALSRAGIPYQFLGPGLLFKQPEVKDLIAYLKILVNPEDSVSFYRVLSMPYFKIDPKDISFLLNFAKKINLSLFQAIEIYLSFFDSKIFQPEFTIYKKYLPLIKKITREKLVFICKIVKQHLALINKETAGQILYYFMEKTGYLAKLIAYKNETDEKKALNVTKFFDRLKSFESENEDASVTAMVNYIDMSLELGESPIVAQTDISTYDAVNIMTVHSAKGLEFPVVFLVNLSTGRFPTYERRETIPIPQPLIKELLPKGDYHLEEERRLFYVGLTRAKDNAFFSSSKFYGERKRERRLSIFVREALGDNFIDDQLSIEKDKRSQLSIFEFKKSPENLIKKKTILNNFSYSQLEAYKRCPRQYKYNYILRIPVAPTSQESFGITIHKTLQNFYHEFLTNNKVDIKRLLKIYKENWIPIGYASLAHQNRMKKEGQKMLRGFFNKFHNQNNKIVNLEKMFKIKLTKDVYLTGKIDRVDLYKNNEIEIVDYKTGQQPDEKILKKSLQLSIYALAANDRNLFNKKINQINLTFFFLQNLEKVTIKRTGKEIEQVKKEIIDLVSEIRKETYPPNVGPICDFCPYRIICEAWQ